MSGRPTLPSLQAPVKFTPEALSGSRASGAQLGNPSCGPVKFHWSDALKSLGFVKSADAAAGSARANRTAVIASTRALIERKNAAGAANLRPYARVSRRASRRAGRPAATPAP